MRYKIGAVVTLKVFFGEADMDNAEQAREIAEVRLPAIKTDELVRGGEIIQAKPIAVRDVDGAA